jgi:hypothetical protein
MTISDSLGPPTLSVHRSPVPEFPALMPGWMWRWLTMYWLTRVGASTCFTK